MTLDKLGIGQSAMIVKVGGEGALRQHFLDMGVIPGQIVRLTKFAPLGDPMELLINGYSLTLRLADAARIGIELVEHESAAVPDDAEVSIEEIAKEAGLEPALVGELLSISRETVSFDTPVGNGSDSSSSRLGDFIEDDGFGPEELAMQKCLREDIDKVLSTLSEKERDIITLRFGLNDTAPMSLKEIGEMYNLTKERIRQIEKRALERLKQPGRAKMLESYTA